MKNLKPSMYQKSIFDINFEKIKKKNIKMIIMDLDNTIAKVDEEVPNPQIIKLFKRLSQDFKIVIASNNFSSRVTKMCQELPCDYYHCVLKPTMKLKRIIAKNYKIKSDEICLIGDQIITDIYLGNRMNVFTILVDPLGEKDLKVTFFNRFLEKWIKKRINLKKGEYYEENQIL